MVWKAVETHCGSGFDINLFVDDERRLLNYLALYAIPLF